MKVWKVVVLSNRVKDLIFEMAKLGMGTPQPLNVFSCSPNKLIEPQMMEPSPF